MATIHGIGPTAQAEYVDKRESNALAWFCLLGVPIRKVVLPDGEVAYATNLRRFNGLDQLEDFLDEIRGVE